MAEWLVFRNATSSCIPVRYSIVAMVLLFKLSGFDGPLTRVSLVGSAILQIFVFGFWVLRHCYQIMIWRRESPRAFRRSVCQKLTDLFSRLWLRIFFFSCSLSELLIEAYGSLFCMSQSSSEFGTHQRWSYRERSIFKVKGLALETAVAVHREVEGGSSFVCAVHEEEFLAVFFTK